MLRPSLSQANPDGPNNIRNRWVGGGLKFVFRTQPRPQFLQWFNTLSYIYVNRCTNDKVYTMSILYFTVPLEYHVYDTLTDTSVRSLSESDLIPVTMKMHNADNEKVLQS